MVKHFKSKSDMFHFSQVPGRFFFYIEGERALRRPNLKRLRRNYFTDPCEDISLASPPDGDQSEGSVSQDLKIQFETVGLRVN